MQKYQHALRSHRADEARSRLDTSVEYALDIEYVEAGTSFPGLYFEPVPHEVHLEMDLERTSGLYVPRSDRFLVHANPQNQDHDLVGVLFLSAEVSFTDASEASSLVTGFTTFEEGYESFVLGNKNPVSQVILAYLFVAEEGADTDDVFDAVNETFASLLPSVNEFAYELTDEKLLAVHDLVEALADRSTSDVIAYATTTDDMFREFKERA